MSKFAGSFASLLQVCVFYFVTLQFTQSEKVTIDNSTCLLKVFNVNDKDSATVLWDGRALMKNCRIGFRVPNKNEYKFVIELKQYVIEDCSFTLFYFYANISVAKQNFSCQSSPSTHRAENVQYLYVQFDTSGTSNSTVEIKVSAKKNEESWFGWIGIVGVVLGSLIFFSLCAKKRNGTNNNQVTNEELTSQPEPQSGTGAETTEPSDIPPDSSVANGVRLADDVTPVEEPTATPLPPPGFASNYVPLSFTTPPPSYEDCVKIELPPSYDEIDKY